MFLASYSDEQLAILLVTRVAWRNSILTGKEGNKHEIQRCLSAGKNDVLSEASSYVTHVEMVLGFQGMFLGHHPG